MCFSKDAISNLTNQLRADGWQGNEEKLMVLLKKEQSTIEKESFLIHIKDRLTSFRKQETDFIFNDFEIIEAFRDVMHVNLEYGYTNKRNQSNHFVDNIHLRKDPQRTINGYHACITIFDCPGLIIDVREYEGDTELSARSYVCVKQPEMAIAI